MYRRRRGDGGRGGVGLIGTLSALFGRRSSRASKKDLAHAIRAGDVTRTKALLAGNADLLDDPSPTIGGNWLHFAAAKGAIEIVDYLLTLGVDVNSPDAEGVSPLGYAAGGGHLDVVKRLLDVGARLDTSTSIRNPLFGAISGSVPLNTSRPPPTGEAPQIVRLLLERGIDAEKRYTAGSMTNMDAVAFAVRMGAIDLAHIVALWNANGEKEAAEQAILEAGPIAEAGLDPVPPDEQYRPS